MGTKTEKKMEVRGIRRKEREEQQGKVTRKWEVRE